MDKLEMFDYSNKGGIFGPIFMKQLIPTVNSSNDLELVSCMEERYKRRVMRDFGMTEEEYERTVNKNNLEENN